MQEMDGLRTSGSSNVVVVGATNRPFDLDDAVLRRLPRRLLIDLPGEEEREAILRIMLRGEEVGGEVDVKGLAKRTEGFSGSDLKSEHSSLSLAFNVEGVLTIRGCWRRFGCSGCAGCREGECGAAVADDEGEGRREDRGGVE